MADPSPQPKPAATALKRAALAVAITLAGLVSWWWLSDRLERVRAGSVALETTRLNASELAVNLRQLTQEVSGLRAEVRESSNRIAGQIAAALGEVSRDVAKLQAEVAALQQFEKFSEREADRLTEELAELRERLEAIEKR